MKLVSNHKINYDLWLIPVSNIKMYNRIVTQLKKLQGFDSRRLIKTFTLDKQSI